MEYSLIIAGSPTITGPATITGTVKCGYGDYETIGIEDWQVTEELNQLPSFNFVTENSTAMREIFSTYNSVPVTIYERTEIIFKGRVDVDKIRFTQTRIHVSGYAKYIDLNFPFFSKDQSQYDIRRVQFDNTQADTILGYVLAGTGYTVSECPTTLISLRGEYESKLQWVSAIAKACKYTSGGDTLSSDWWIDTNDAVHIAQSRGNAKGAINLTESTEREVDYSTIQNSAHELGYGDGINQLKSNKTNTASITAYGTRESSKIDRRFQNQTSLDDETQEQADAYAQPIEKIDCSISSWEWFDKSLAVGDTITLTDGTTGISGSYRIKKATIGPVWVMLNVANVIPRLSSEVQDIKRQLHIDGGYMQGQTVPLNYSGMDNVESGYPLKLNMHIPVKTVSINACYISFDLELFRGQVTATGGGGGQTTSTKDTHTHGIVSRSYHWDDEVTALNGAINDTVTTITVDSTASLNDAGSIYIDDEKISYTGKTSTTFTGCTRGIDGTSAAAHEDNSVVDGEIINLIGLFDDLTIPAIKMGTNGQTAPLKSETSDGGGAHDHTVNDHVHAISYGITEDSDNSPSVSIEIDSVDRTSALGGPWASDQEEIDITAYIQTTGKHTVELLSTERARLQADIWAQVFIQSD